MSKKAFTLAEILIVLMVIGVIAALLSLLSANVNDAKYKTQYKKAYQEITSIAGQKYLEGKIPVNASSATLADVFETLLLTLDSKFYTAVEDGNFDSGNTVDSNSYKTGINYTNSSGATMHHGGDNVLSASNDFTSSPSPWIITENNISYSVTGKSNSRCYSKEDLNALKGENVFEDLENHACAVIVVDLNGPDKGPNIIEPQVKTGIFNKKINILKGDRYYIYIGTNGASAGSKNSTITGQILK